MVKKEYHCNICHQYDGDGLAMILHFEENHPREWKATEKNLFDNPDKD